MKYIIHEILIRIYLCNVTHKYLFDGTIKLIIRNQFTYKLVIVLFEETAYLLLVQFGLHCHRKNTFTMKLIRNIIRAFIFVDTTVFLNAIDWLV